MRSSLFSFVVLLALIGASPAAAETEDECKNNTDAQKFLDGKCNVLKGYDAIPGAVKEEMIQKKLIFEGFPKSGPPPGRPVRKKIDQPVSGTTQILEEGFGNPETLEEKKKSAEQPDRQSEKTNRTGNSTEQTKQTQTDLDKAKPK